MRKPRARKLAIRIAACVLIGAAATVGVAWGLFLTPPEVSDGEPAHASEWPIRVPASWPSQPQQSEQSTEVVRCFGRWIFYGDGWRPDPQCECILNVYRSGWPALALQSFSGRAALYPGLDERAEGLPTPRWLARLSPAAGILLPSRPLWPGFALDTAFYAAIALTLWSAPPAIRRRLRHSRGHCPACGYDLKGAPSATCPECGS
jgi:hypothetical protein